MSPSEPQRSYRPLPLVHAGLEGAAAIEGEAALMRLVQRRRGAGFFRLTVVRPTPERPAHYPDGLYLEGWPERPDPLPPFADFPIPAPPDLQPAAPAEDEEVKLL